MNYYPKYKVGQTLVRDGRVLEIIEHCFKGTNFIYKCLPLHIKINEISGARQVWSLTEEEFDLNYKLMEKAFIPYINKRLKQILD